MGFKMGLVVGAGLGYVLGARAGRERYEDLRRAWENFLGNPQVQQIVERGRDVVEDATNKGLHVVHEGVEKATGTVQERLEGGDDDAT